MALFLNDTFTEVGTVLLQSHTPEVGGSWVRHPNFVTNANVETTFASGSSATLDSVYYNSVVPTSPDYYVEAILDFKTITAPLNGVLGRVSSSASTYYQAYINGSTWTLDVVVNGTPTNLGTYVSAIVAGVPRTLRLVMSGTKIQVFLDGVERISAFNSAITTAGFAGIRSRLDGKINSIGAELNPIFLKDTSLGLGKMRLGL